jgi:hypothetical protein
MKLSRIPWTTLSMPSIATAALLLALSGCSPSESQAEQSKASMPSAPAEPKPEPKPERTALSTTPEPPAPVKPIEPTPKPPEPTPEPPVANPVPPPAPVPLPKDPPPPEPAPKPADVSVTGFEIGGAVGPDGHVTEPKTVFAATDSVRLSVLADGAPRLVRLSVEWYGPDGQRISEDVQDVTLNGAMAVPFTLSNAKGLALGAYRAEIRIESWLSSTADFEVR